MEILALEADEVIEFTDVRLDIESYYKLIKLLSAGECHVDVYANGSLLNDPKQVAHVQSHAIRELSITSIPKHPDNLVDDIEHFVLLIRGSNVLLWHRSKGPWGYPLKKQVRAFIESCVASGRKYWRVAIVALPIAIWYLSSHILFTIGDRFVIQLFPFWEPFNVAAAMGLGFLFLHFTVERLDESISKLWNQAVIRNEFAGRGRYADERAKLLPAAALGVILLLVDIIVHLLLK